MEMKLKLKLKAVPKKPFGSLAEYIRKTGIWFRACDLAAGKTPCVECLGRGGYRDPKDLCPVEGYKMAPLYVCKKCGGSREGKKKDWAESYRRVMQAWRRNRDEAVETNALIRSAASKLTADERRVLGFLQEVQSK